MNRENEIILDVQNLKKYFPIRGGLITRTVGHVKAVDGISFKLRRGETLGIVGESGCGKSTAGRTILRLHDITDGKVIFKGEDLAKCSKKEMRAKRLQMQMVFQDPYASLNPRMTVGNIIGEALLDHKLMSKAEAREKVLETMEICGLPTYYINRYPHEFSGGQRQRVALARAVVKRSDYFLLDEPLSNLDAQLRLRARKELVKIHEMYRPTMVYVTHDQIEAMTVGQRVAIMYRGNMEMLDTPSHVYNMPASIFCARFIGSPSMNIISCQYENGNLSIGDQMIRLAPMWRPIADACPSGKYCVGIRPEHIVLSSRPTETSICGTVKYVEDYGNRYGVYIDVKGEKSELIAICNDSVPRPGENIFMNIDFRKLHLFDAQSEKSLGYPEEIRRLNAALDFSMPDAQNKNQKTGGKYHESFGQYQCV